MKRTLMFPILLLVALAAIADGPEDAYQDGLDAFDAGDHRAALAAFQRARDTGMDTPQLHFNLGVSHYRLGQLDRADRAFARAAEGPELAGLALYNRGRVATRDNRPADAERHYRAALERARTERIRELARTALDALREAAPTAPGTTVLAELGLGYDSNTALQGDDDRVDGSRSDTFADLLLYGNGRLLGDRQRGLRLHGLLNGTRHADNATDDFDRVETGLTGFRRPGPWHQEIGANVSRSRLDGDRLQTTLEAHGEIERALAHDLHAGLRYRIARIDAGDAFRGLDGLRQDMRARLRGRADDARWRVDYVLEHNDRDDIQQDNGVISYSPTRHGLRAHWSEPLTDTLRASVDGGVRYSDYPDREATPDGRERREDVRLQLGARLSRELTRNLSLLARLRWTDNHSSIDRYRYDRLRGSIGLEYLYP